MAKPNSGNHSVKISRSRMPGTSAGKDFGNLSQIIHNLTTAIDGLDKSISVLNKSTETNNKLRGSKTKNDDWYKKGTNPYSTRHEKRLKEIDDKYAEDMKEISDKGYKGIVAYRKTAEAELKRNQARLEEERDYKRRQKIIQQQQMLIEKKRLEDWKREQKQNKEFIKTMKKKQKAGEELTKQQQKDLKKAQSKVSKPKPTTTSSADAYDAYSDFVEGKGTGIYRGGDAKLAVAERREQQYEGKGFAKYAADKMKSNALDMARQAVDSIYSELKSQVEDLSMSIGPLNARLQGLNGSNTAYEDIIEDAINGLSGVYEVNSKKVIENIKTLTEKGVGFNLEYRGFIAGLAENIQSAFNVSNDSLLRLIRLQQEESTDTRLALMARLTRLFNASFSDSSYISSQFEQIEGLLLEANSLLNADESLALEYQVQKILGALYSTGASSSFIEGLANAINYLGTGDITKLSSNEPLLNLVAMGMSQGNISIGDILTKGINAEESTLLLAGILKYMGEIAKDTDSLVVKSAFGGVFGFTQSDLKAVQTLINSPQYSQLLNEGVYFDSSTARTYLNEQIGQIGDRMGGASIISNLKNNLITKMAGTYALNGGMYGLFTVMDALSDLTKGIPIPAFSVMGTGIDLHTDVSTLMKMGTLLTGLVGSLFTGGGGFSLNSAIINGESGGLNSLRYAKLSKYGQSISPATVRLKGIQETSSESATVQNYDVGTMQTSEGAKAIKEADENKSAYITDEAQEQADMMQAVYKAMNSQGDGVAAVVPYNPDYSIHLGTLYEALFSHDNYVMVDLHPDSILFRQFLEYMNSARDVNITDIDSTAIMTVAQSLNTV